MTFYIFSYMPIQLDQNFYQKHIRFFKKQKKKMCLYNWCWARIYFSRHCTKFLTLLMLWIQIKYQRKCFSPSTLLHLLLLSVVISGFLLLMLPVQWWQIAIIQNPLESDWIWFCHLIPHLSVCELIKGQEWKKSDNDNTCSLDNKQVQILSFKKKKKKN